MAVLQTEDLSLEIVYRHFGSGNLSYNIWFRWRAEPVLNEKVLRRRNQSIQARPDGAVFVEAYFGCGILPVLRRVLETNEPDYWETDLPGLIFAAYPGMVFPFLESKRKLLWETPESKAKRETHEQEKTAKGMLPDDLIDLIIAVDAQNFEGVGTTCMDGVCFRMLARRDQLETFYSELRVEYVEFKRKYPIDEYQHERRSPDFEEWF